MNVVNFETKIYNIDNYYLNSFNNNIIMSTYSLLWLLMRIGQQQQLLLLLPSPPLLLPTPPTQPLQLLLQPLLLLLTPRGVTYSYLITLQWGAEHSALLAVLKHHNALVASPFLLILPSFLYVAPFYFYPCTVETISGYSKRGDVIKALMLSLGQHFS